jgi:hypothetical protein
MPIASSIYELRSRQQLRLFLEERTLPGPIAQDTSSRWNIYMPQPTCLRDRQVAARAFRYSHPERERPANQATATYGSVQRSPSLRRHGVRWIARLTHGEHVGSRDDLSSDQDSKTQSRPSFCRRCRSVARLPSAFVLQRLRQIPMIKRRQRRDSRRDELAHQPVVEVEALGIRRARAPWGKMRGQAMENR